MLTKTYNNLTKIWPDPSRIWLLPPWIFFFIFLKFYWSIVIYKIVIIFAVQQSDSVIHIHKSILQILSYIYYHRILGRVPCAIKQDPISQSSHSVTRLQPVILIITLICPLSFSYYLCLVPLCSAMTLSMLLAVLLISCLFCCLLHYPVCNQASTKLMMDKHLEAVDCVCVCIIILCIYRERIYRIIIIAQL